MEAKWSGQTPRPSELQPENQMSFLKASIFKPQWTKQNFLEIQFPNPDTFWEPSTNIQKD